MQRPELDPADLAELAIFPLPNVALFPGAALALHVFEPRYRDLLRHVLGGRRCMAVARLKPGYEADYEGRPAVFEVCGVGIIEEHSERPDGRSDITLRGLARVRIVSELPPAHAFRQVRAVLVPDTFIAPALFVAFQLKLQALWARLAPHLPEPVRDLRALTQAADTPGAYADRLAAAIVADPDGTQQLLAEPDPSERLRLLTERLEELAAAVSPRSAPPPARLN